MNLRNVMVHVDGDARCRMRARVAVKLAEAHGARIIGVAATGRQNPSTFMSAAHQQIEDARQSHDRSVDQTHGWTELFKHWCEAEKCLNPVEAAAYDGEAATVLAYRAHGADLCIVSQAHARGEAEFVESVLLHSARPTLVLPEAVPLDHLGRIVLLAWDDSRSVACAAADALPMLTRAKVVHLCTWYRHGEVEPHALHQRLSDVGKWLASHGVHCEIHTDAAQANIGNTILQTAQTLAADLLVMGSYGHSRWSERLLGGVTRTVLSQAHVPVLMSR